MPRSFLMRRYKPHPYANVEWMIEDETKNKLALQEKGNQTVQLKSIKETQASTDRNIGHTYPVKISNTTAWRKSHIVGRIGNGKKVNMERDQIIETTLHDSVVCNTMFLQKGYQTIPESLNIDKSWNDKNIDKNAKLEKSDILVPSPVGDSTGLNQYKIEPNKHENEKELFYNVLNQLSNDEERKAENKIKLKYLNNHLVGNTKYTYSKLKLHQCKVCFKSFQRASSLSNHRLIHSKTKSYHCGQCDMDFLRKSDLAKHVIVHSGSKPYECGVCGKKFSQSSNMLTHQRRHSGVRPYSCLYCGKSFYRKVDVRRHSSVHVKT